MHWFLGILLSDLVIFFSFPPFPLGLSVFVVLVPVFMAMESSRSWQQVFFRAWIFAFIGNCAICFWVAPTLEEFADISPWLSIPAVAALSIFEQSCWPVMAVLRFILHRRFGIRPLLWTPACIMVLDYAWPKFFPNTLGNCLYSVPLLTQFSDVAGVWGLSGVIVMVNEIIAEWIVRAWPAQERRRHTVVAVTIAFLFLGYSIWRYVDIQRMIHEADSHVSVSIIQPNINPIALVRASFYKQEARLQHAMPLIQMTRQAVAEKKPDFVFWPETAISNTYASGDARETLTVTRAIDEMVKGIKVPLLFGARDRKGDDLYNALFLVSPKDGGDLAIQRYYKSRLLWIGEYMPLSKTFPAIADHIRSQGGTTFTPGAGAMTYDLQRSSGLVQLGPMICLEGLYSSYVREIALAGADVLVNATNDGWFGKGMEPALHLYLTAFRSVETRRPLVRATTTGHSAVVDIDGTLRVKTALDEERIVHHDVPVYPRIFSLYLWWGATPIWCAAAWWIFWMMVGWRLRRTSVLRPG